MEDFSEPFLEVFAWVRDHRPTAEQIIAKMEEPDMDQYMVCHSESERVEQGGGGKTACSLTHGAET